MPKACQYEVLRPRRASKLPGLLLWGAWERPGLDCQQADYPNPPAATSPMAADVESASLPEAAASRGALTGAAAFTGAAAGSGAGAGGGLLRPWRAMACSAVIYSPATAEATCSGGQRAQKGDTARCAGTRGRERTGMASAAAIGPRRLLRESRGCSARSSGPALHSTIGALLHELSTFVGTAGCSPKAMEDKTAAIFAKKLMDCDPRACRGTAGGE